MSIHRTRYIFLCTLSLLLFSCLSLPMLAQWVPLIAKTHEERTVSTPGMPTQHEVVEGTIYRASNGSQLEQTKMFKDGKLIEDGGVLLNTHTMRYYSIDYTTKVVHEMQVPVSLHKPTMGGTIPKQDQDIVNGLKCRVLPVVMEGNVLGKSWVSNEYDLQIKSDYTVHSGKYTTRIQGYAYDIQGNHEPNKSVFALNPSFRVITNPNSH